ncbi:TadA family conjugal transfer-associated ATPase [Dermacoccaceae bacterium W4C1]
MSSGMGAGIWDQIRAGRAPSDAGVDDLAAEQALVLGDRAAELRGRLAADVLGAGPLETLLALPGVTDVLVNGTHGVFVDRGDGLERAAVELHDAEQVRRLATRLAASAGRRLDDACPYVDGLLPGGVRLHAVLPPLVDGAAHVSLRVPRAAGLDLSRLVATGAVHRDLAPVLTALVATRRAFVVSGGTGTGKTTMLAALLATVAPQERIVIVEDVRELAVPHPHVVRLESRAPNVEGRGEVTMSTLVRQALRMRPDRLVVGEVRGAEVRDLLSALNTGHEGGCGTVHANAVDDVVARFEALGALAGMPPAAVRTQLAAAVQVVLHLRRDARGRRLVQIGVLVPSADGLRFGTAWRVEGDDLLPGPEVDRLRAVLRESG